MMYLSLYSCSKIPSTSKEEATLVDNSKASYNKG